LAKASSIDKSIGRLARSLGIRVTGAKARGVKSAPLGLARISNILVTNASASIADFAFFASTHSANCRVTFTTITVTTTTDSFQPAMGSSWAGIISVWTRQRRSLESVAVAASMCCIAPLGAGGGGRTDSCRVAFSSSARRALEAGKWG